MPENITYLKPNEYFVFGSNGEGLHYGGAARIAHQQFGAIMGNPRGIQGNSYAVDTMSGIDVIKEQIPDLFEYIEGRPNDVFYITALGCGIAGYSPTEIAPLFKEFLVLHNVYLPKSFFKILTA
jgi:hypothetical protein